VPDAGAADAARTDAALSYVVNGYELNAREIDVVNVVAQDVVPHLEGAREDRLTLAARGSWWALKEGVWELPLDQVYGYSNCNTSAGDRRIGPLESCGSGRAWQVGMAAVQVPGRTVSGMEALASRLFPGTPAGALLADVAAQAGFPKGGATSNAIVASTGSLRVSWLLRVPAVGFADVVPGEIVPECITGTKSWCFGTGWTETKKFAPTKTAALKSIADLRAILDALAP
jgi:hypothetical protein